MNILELFSVVFSLLFVLAGAQTLWDWRTVKLKQPSFNFCRVRKQFRRRYNAHVLRLGQTIQIKRCYAAETALKNHFQSHVVGDAKIDQLLLHRSNGDERSLDVFCQFRSDSPQQSVCIMFLAKENRECQIKLCDRILLLPSSRVLVIHAEKVESIFAPIGTLLAIGLVQ